MAAPKPISLTQVDTNMYTGLEPQPFVIVGDIPGSGGGDAVASVNGQTGTVVLDAGDVGALPASYTAPVASVNGKTGTVALTASDVGALPTSYAPDIDALLASFSGYDAGAVQTLTNTNGTFEWVTNE